MTNTKKLAIVGGGPGGLAAARVFLNNCPQFDVDLFEKQCAVGGVWNYDDCDGKNGKVMYDHLETNLCKQIMQFSKFPFPSTVPTFPTRKDVLNYLKDYYKSQIEQEDKFSAYLNTEVVNIEKKEGNDSNWLITTKNTLNNEIETRKYDNVIICNGHYEYSNLPLNIVGMKEYIEKKSAFHSKDFQNCEFAKDKTVVVIGNGSSGQDITIQLSTVAKKVYHSVNDISKNAPINDYISEINCVEFISRIVECDVKTHSISLLDGRVIDNIDYIICATGYKYDFPFMEPKLKDKLLGNNKGSKDSNQAMGSRVYNLWEQISFVEDPTMGFLLLSQNVIPFPLSELQATVLSKVFEGKIKIPDDFKPDNDNEKYHYFPSPSDIDYYLHLQKLLDNVNHNDKFTPIYWDEYRQNLRHTSADDKAERNKKLIKHAEILREKGLPYQLIPPTCESLEDLQY